MSPPAAPPHAQETTVCEGAQDKPFRAEGTVAPQNGQQIGRYEVIGKVGAGAMGQVYRALDPELQRQVAIKVHSLHPGITGSMQELRARLLREGRTLACISDPNVVAVYDVGLFRGQVFVAMELVAGCNLRQWVVAEKRSVREIVEVYLGAAAGLAAAHRVGVIHRDVKPANIVIGDDGRVRVLDFGLALAHSSPQQTTPTGLSAHNQLTCEGRVMGTPAYIAPEQLAGREVDHRGDQFSFCVALWKALSGTLPFAGSTLEERASAIESGMVQGRKKIPRSMREVLLRGLRADPRRRHASMNALSMELRKALGRPRRRALAGIATFSILALAFVLMWLSPGPIDTGSDISINAKERQLEADFQNANNLFLQDKIEESLVLMERMIADPSLPKHTGLAADVWSQAAKLHNYSGNDDRADELNDLAMDAAKQIQDDFVLLDGWVTRLSVKVTQRDEAQFKRFKEEARALAPRVPVPALQVELELAILNAEIERGDLLDADSTASSLRNSPAATSDQNRGLIAEPTARLALLQSDYSKAESLARTGLLALAHDEQLPPALGWRLMSTRATALHQLGQTTEASEIFSQVFEQIGPNPDIITSRFLIEFARERLSQGHMYEAALALAHLEQSREIDPALRTELRALASQIPD